MRRPVEVVGPGGGVQRVPDRDLVSDDENRGFGPLEQLAIGDRITPGGVIQLLAPGEIVTSLVPPFPLAVVLDGRAFEVADVNVVHKRLDLEGDVPAGEGDLRRLPRAAEAGVEAEVDPDVRELPAEEPSLLAAILCQGHGQQEVPVDPVFQVQARLAVTSQHVELHASQARRAPQLANRLV